MTVVGRTRRVTRLVFLALSVVVVFSVGGVRPAWAAADDPGAEAALRSLANRERAARGLGPLVEAGDLVTVARRHSGRMLSRDEVFHNPNLSSEVGGWELLGENVGLGASAQDIHDALMASKVHRDVILDRRFTEVGMGVLVENGELWVTQVFRLPEARPQSSPGTTAPADAPDSGSQPSATPAGPAATTSGRAVTGGASDVPAATVAGAPAGATTAAVGSVQVAGPSQAAPAGAQTTNSSSLTQDAAEAGAPPADPLGNSVVIDSATPAAISVPLPLPEPPEIPALGLLAAGLLLLVVGSTSMTTTTD